MQLRPSTSSLRIGRLVGSLILLGSLMLSFSAVGATPPSPEAGDYTRAAAGDADQLSFVAVNGVKLAYRLEGAGVPVIFVHGEGYSHELWTEQVEPISQGYLFISYDRRGHGVSEDPLTGYSETAHAEDLNALMQHLGLEEAHFVANSRGGAIIIQFLKLFPHRVRSITFADATIPLVPIPEQSAFHGAVPRLNGPAPTLEQALQGREGAKKSSFTRVAQSQPAARAILDRMSDQYSPRVSMNPQRSDMGAALHVGPWNARDFPNMKTMYQPILLVVGELTDTFFIEGAREAHRLWPNTRHAMIPATDHLLMLEDPKTFNRLILDFFAEVEDAIAGRAALTEVKAGGDY